MIEDIRVVNYYKDAGDQRLWRHEIQVKKNGEWVPVDVLVREDIGDLTVLPGELEEDKEDGR
jgi:hypothetical protein